MTHGYLGPHAIFVCKTGDWKLGALDLAANTTAVMESSVVLNHGHLLGAPYQPPERKSIDDAALKCPVGSADIYSLAQVNPLKLCTAASGHTGVYMRSTLVSLH
jgi:hypothetical protein